MEDKKIYVKPELSFVVLSTVDIITTSNPEKEWEDDNVKDDGWVF